ncbi:hypothetical protein BDD14_3830 [Edaphobacter modestus]|uniref:Uncharacterized protein n=1 Tax=Edaphobacter modestus TaxID=388466 RepID=A0A4Q7YYK2_9BACT|nr:hypothetical protein BDD14_3830 [Edaphobacter modestus]
MKTSYETVHVSRIRGGPLPSNRFVTTYGVSNIGLISCGWQWGPRPPIQGLKETLFLQQPKSCKLVSQETFSFEQVRPMSRAVAQNHFPRNRNSWGFLSFSLTSERIGTEKTRAPMVGCLQKADSGARAATALRLFRWPAERLCTLARDRLLPSSGRHRPG